MSDLCVALIALALHFVAGRLFASARSCFLLLDFICLSVVLLLVCVVLPIDRLCPLMQ